MTSYKLKAASLAMALSTTMLIGCDSGHQATQTTTKKVTTVTATATKSTLPSDAVQRTLAKPNSSVTSNPKNTLASPSVNETAARKPLVLKVDQTMLTDDTIKQPPLARSNVLPDLFEDDGSKEKKVISGGLLVDKESSKLNDAIDGAEISLELQTN
ncbi:hypothetical protein [Spartinivicinus poritis]|uniref:Lipoprotein n=1 Tax=Spartinivicinus poritis TaxID=2994640 RepID=A0ABT5U2Z9_9GAMM|nr:hypothetical protein [Spartinivicinus sp. A2-2]MDE1460736.1 hypothetical protein [Spartinivicinus sp. A2-2]